MARGKLRNLLIKGGICLLFLHSTHALAQELLMSEDEAQLQFTIGVGAMIAGKYEDAIQILDDLYAKTKAPRVKLEWARAAYFAKKFDLSRKLFEEVLADPLPDIVRFNISLYLTEIAKVSDLTDYGFKFVRDTNPFVVAGQQVITIYGIPFNYTPLRPRETLSGLNLFFTHSKSIVEDGSIRLIAGIDHTQYQGENNSKSALKLATQLKHDPQDNWSVRLGFDNYFQRGVSFLEQPYVGYQYRRDQLEEFLNSYQIDLRYGKNRYPDYSFVDGTFKSLSVSGSKNVNSTLRLSGTVYLDESGASLRSQAFKTTSVNLAARMFIPEISSNTSISYTRSNRNFDETDELFIVKRSDTQQLFVLSLQPYSLKLFDLYPSIEVGIERQMSNVSIAEFDRKFVNLALRKHY